jgi:DNA polymerase-1
MSERKRLFIVDGHALAFRSFYAMMRQPMRSSKGEELGAVFGYATTLVRILDEEKPDYFAVAFDPPGPTFRHEQYPQYKATRQKMPDEMREQMPRIMEVTDALEVPKLMVEGYEADDVMATVALQAAAADVDVFLVTADKDFGQIVNDHIKMYNLRARQSGVDIIDTAAIEEKFGVPPTGMRDLLALMGDSSDNIPGVKGVGQKTAASLLQEYGSLEEIYEHLEDLKGKAVGKKLEAEKDNAYKSRELVTFATDIDYGHSLEDLAWSHSFSPRAGELFKELEFRSLLGYVTEHRDEEAKAPEPEKNYQAVTDSRGLTRLIALLRGAGSFSFDTETTSQRPMEADIVGLSFSAQVGRAYYIPLNHFEDLEAKEVLNKLKPLLEDENLAKTAQNAKYDMLVLRRAGIEVRGLDFDTMIASYVLDPGARSHGLDYLSLRYLDYKKIPTSDLIGSGRKQITMDMVDLETITEYACEDADYTWRLRQELEPRIKEMDAQELFHELEIPLVEVLELMEWNGIALDTDLLKSLSGEMQDRLEDLQVKIYREAGEEFNINSPQQLGEIFFDKLGIHKETGYKPKKTPTGQWRTDVNVLEALKKHPLPAMILDWRQLSKLKGTYVDALPKLVNPDTGRVHGSFNQTVAATGRLSSTDPNLQNIPVRTELGREIRKAFIPGEGFDILLSADYSQIELRIAAEFSGDPALINAFKTGKDIHRETAALLFHIKPEEVDRDQRDFAKRINFGILYGMGPHRFRQETGVSFNEAKKFIEDYKATFTGINQYLEETLAFAKDNGYVTTIMGRRRYLPDLTSSNPGIRSHAENMAINTPIQGSAADIIKRAMIDIHNDLRRTGMKSRMVLQVHDELVFEVAPGERDKLKDLVVSRMEGAIDLSVPVLVDTGFGSNWLEAH